MKPRQGNTLLGRRRPWDGKPLRTLKVRMTYADAYAYIYEQNSNDRYGSRDTGGWGFSFLSI